MRTDCPKCYTPLELDDWQRSKCGGWTTLYQRCPCCDYTGMEFDFKGAPQLSKGIPLDKDGKPLPTLHEIYARMDERQAAKKAVQS